MNDKLSTPVDVKSKTNRLLLYTKSSQDYNILLTEIRTAKLAYHTYPLPETTQPRLVLKGIPPNVPEEDISEELATHNIQTVHVTQLTNMDKTTKTVITRYPIFVVTFQPGTDMQKVLELHKLCHCIVKWEKYKNSRPIRQCFNCQSFGHSSTFCGRPPKCVKCDQQNAPKDCPKPASSPQNVSTVEESTQQTLLVAPSIYNNSTTLGGVTTHNNGRDAARKQTTHLSNINSRSSLYSRRTNHPPHPAKHGLNLCPNPHPTPLSNASVQ